MVVYAKLWSCLFLLSPFTEQYFFNKGVFENLNMCFEDDYMTIMQAKNYKFPRIKSWFRVYSRLFPLDSVKYNNPRKCSIVFRQLTGSPGNFVYTTATLTTQRLLLKGYFRVLCQLQFSKLEQVLQTRSPKVIIADSFVLSKWIYVELSQYEYF